MSVEPGDLVYLAETQHVLFPLHDPVFAPDAAVEGPHLSVIVDGVYSTMARAEAALDARLSRYAGVRATTSLRPRAVGLLTDEHGGAVTWSRTVVWDGPDGQAVEAWQQVVATRVDALP
jgi:hypothetical protein